MKPEWVCWCSWIIYILQCLATIATVYWRSNEESVEGDKPPKTPVLESRDTVYASNSRADRVQGLCQYIPKCISVGTCNNLVFLFFFSHERERCQFSQLVADSAHLPRDGSIVYFVLRMPLNGGRVFVPWLGQAVYSGLWRWGSATVTAQNAGMQQIWFRHWRGDGLLRCVRRTPLCSSEQRCSWGLTHSPKNTVKYNDDCSHCKCTLQWQNACAPFRDRDGYENSSFQDYNCCI